MRTGYQNRAITPENNRGLTRAENRAATARRQEETRARVEKEGYLWLTEGMDGMGPKGKTRDVQYK